MAKDGESFIYNGRSGKKRGSGLGDIPLWFVVAFVASVPLHYYAWSWFLVSGVTLTKSLSSGLVSSPMWLTSIFYFPVGLVIVALTEFAAIFPLNLLVFIFGIRQQRILRDAKHFVAYRSS